MELPSLDLNLVVVLHALLEERNVTRAGERVGLSQPGTSSALARLRRHFDDPLLERVGTVYELTPLAQALRGQLGSTMEQLQRVLAAQPRFDPATADRRFTVACSDSVLTVLGPGLVAAVTRAAPHVSLDLRSLDRRVVTDPLALLRDVDLLVVPRGLFSLPDVPSVELYRDRWVCATWRGNTAVGDRLSLADVGRARWVMPFQELLMASPADAALATLGVDRHCAVRVESFSLLDRLVVGTELLVLFHERLAGELTAHDLRVVELPVELPPITETAWSHPSRRLDPGHRWLVDVLTEVSAGLGQPQPAGLG
ncbi:LysR substrate-binding domain-containing protein [Modestobacter excelsi]|uniref:LysR substrate-binding domain-containing protein n=1 Tax=Modestobacter excelsi TaxID=2213161 RepID=UPI001C20CFDB|nr:LysR substrate-binding domain-containing protein [Modestobacter excelsi]